MLIEPNYLLKFKVEKDSHEFKIIGKEMSKHFKQNIWFLFHKFPLEKIKLAFKACKKQEVYTIAYIVAILNKLQ